MSQNLTQTLIKDIKEKESMLIDDIKKIEDAFESDVVVFKGIIEPKLVGHLLRMIKDTKSENRNRLTIIMTSPGGEPASAIELYHKLDDCKLYNELWIVAYGILQSAGTIFSFAADKLFVIDPIEGDSWSKFGMIDPQYPMSNSNTWVSVFALMETYRYDCKFELDNSNVITVNLIDLNESATVYDDERYPRVQSYLKELRKFSGEIFNILINHNLKNIHNKEEKALSIIKSSMKYDLYRHESFIQPYVYEEMGLQMQRLNSDVKLKQAFYSLEAYIDRLSAHIYPDCGTVCNGNLLTCFIQSKSELLY